MRVRDASMVVVVLHALVSVVLATPVMNCHSLTPILLQCPFAVLSGNSPSFCCHAPSLYVGVSLLDWHLPLPLGVLPPFVVSVLWDVGLDNIRKMRLH